MKLNKLYKTYWDDSKSEHATTLNEFIRKGFAKKESVGWLVYEDKDRIVLCSEKDREEKFKPEMSGDFTMINRTWVKKMERINGH